jgi:hypothetical protein
MMWCQYNRTHANMHAWQKWNKSKLRMEDHEEEWEREWEIEWEREWEKKEGKTWRRENDRVL